MKLEDFQTLDLLRRQCIEVSTLSYSHGSELIMVDKRYIHTHIYLTLQMMHFTYEYCCRINILFEALCLPLGGILVHVFVDFCYVVITWRTRMLHRIHILFSLSCKFDSRTQNLNQKALNVRKT
jgi:hypothetical protein